MRTYGQIAMLRRPPDLGAILASPITPPARRPEVEGESQRAVSVCRVALCAETATAALATVAAKWAHFGLPGLDEAMSGAAT